MKHIINFFNKVFTHDRDKVGDFGFRAVLHIPVGFFMGLLDWTNGFGQMFEFYEKNEDLHTQDQAWKDVYGTLVGFFFGRLVLVGLITWLIIYLIRG